MQRLQGHFSEWHMLTQMLWQCLVINAGCGVRAQKKLVLAGRKQEVFFLGCSCEDSRPSKLDVLLWRTDR